MSALLISRRKFASEPASSSVADAVLPHSDALNCARFGPGAMTMAQSNRRFPAFDVWQTMSESEQDALLAKIERARRRSEAFTNVLIAVLAAAAASGALHLVSRLQL